MNDKERSRLSSVRASAAYDRQGGRRPLRPSALSILFGAGACAIDFACHADDLLCGWRTPTARRRGAPLRATAGPQRRVLRLAENGASVVLSGVRRVGAVSACVGRGAPWPAVRATRLCFLHHPASICHRLLRSPARSRALPPRRRAKRFEADALQFSSDMWSSARCSSLLAYGSLQVGRISAAALVWRC